MIYVRKLRVKQYKIVITDGANKQIGQFLRYVRNTLCNEQAYESLKEDYRETLHELETMAGIIAIDNNALLKKRKLRKKCSWLRSVTSKLRLVVKLLKKKQMTKKMILTIFIIAITL